MAGTYFTGLGLGFSLILAIGPQNAFVLRQGLRGEHVLPICLICAVSDAAFIIFGVTGFQAVLERHTWLEPALRYGGAAFLFWFGVRSFRAALKTSEGLSASDRPPAPLGRTLAFCLALTWLNPYVYLDTVVMLGLLSTGFPGAEFQFAAGAVSASFIFFFGLGYGAALLRPLFAKARTWRILETTIGLLVWSVALKLMAAS